MFCVYYTGSAVAITFFSLTSGSDVAVTSCLTLGSAVSVMYCVSCIWVVWSSLLFVLFFVCFVLFVCFEAHLCGACVRTTLRYSSEVSRLLHLGRVLCVCPYIWVGCCVCVRTSGSVVTWQWHSARLLRVSGSVAAVIFLHHKRLARVISVKRQRWSSSFVSVACLLAGLVWLQCDLVDSLFCWLTVELDWVWSRPH